MNDEQIVKYVRDMIVDNLVKRDFWQEAAFLKFDETNKILVTHIDGLIELFIKAKEILKGTNNDSNK